MPAAAAIDAATNASTVATQISTTYDGTAPSVVLTTGAPDPTNGAFTVTATFSETVTDVAIEDFVVGNGDTSAFNAVSGTVYTVLVTPTADGLVTIDMPAAAAIDTATNTSTVASQISTTYDGTDPTVVLSTPAANPTNAPFTVTATFSEPVTGVTVSDFNVVNGTKTAFIPVSSSVYTVLVTPTIDGTVKIDMAIAAASDTAGNTSTAAIELVREYDSTSPTINIVANPTSVHIGDTSTITFTLSEPSTDFTAWDVVVAWGTLSAFAGSGTGYTATFTPTASSITTGTIDVASSTFTDNATNGNTAATQATIAVDTIAPSIVIGATPTNTYIGSTSAITFTLSEPSTNFTAWDVVVVWGTLSAFAGSGTGYTATFTPTASSTATGTIDVAASTFTDAFGNNNTVATQTTIAVDTVAPSVILSAPVSTTNTWFTLTATFSEPVTGTTLWDFVVGNGTASSFSAVSSTVYTVFITPSADGVVTVNMPAAAAIDTATNPSIVATQLSVTYDTAQPTVVLSTSAANPVNGQFTVTATFSEAATGVTLWDFAIGNGTASSFSQTSPSVYTLSITPTVSNNIVTIDLPAAVATDLSGNANTAATTLTRTYNAPSSGGGGGGGSSLPITVAKPVVLSVTGSGATTETGTTDTGSVNQPATEQELSTLSQDYIGQLIALWAVNVTRDEFMPEKDITRVEFLKILFKVEGIDYQTAKAPKNKFIDLEDGKWTTKVAYKAVELGVSNGYDDGTFRPDATISRIEAIKFILKLKHVALTETTKTLFIDVTDNWMKKYVNTAKELGIISGQETNAGPIFRPFDLITRGESAKVIIKAHSKGV